MGLFQKVFEQFKQKDTKVVGEATDERKAECPYCSKKLEKIPGKKTKCPYCNQFIYVRTRPKDKVRILATKEQADKIDEEWRIIMGTQDEYIAEKENFDTERKILRKHFGREPFENDIKWGILNKKLMEYAQNGDWGLYRNVRFEMAEILRQEMKFKDALRTYLEICYLDLNGPTNSNILKDEELLKEFPPFDPEHDSFLAPGVIDRIQRILKKLNLKKEQIKLSFIRHNSRVGKSLKLPLLPEQCWDKLEKKLGEALGVSVDKLLK